MQDWAKPEYPHGQNKNTDSAGELSVYSIYPVSDYEKDDSYYLLPVWDQGQTLTARLSFTSSGE